MTLKPLIIIIVSVTIFIIAFMLSVGLIEIAPFLNSPEKQEQAEVVERRKVKQSHDPSGDPGGYTLYLVTFKFSDGSMKEFLIGVDKYGEQSCNYINDGDTGILTYKERKNIEQKYWSEDQRWEGRQFISFEKDPELGRVKVEKTVPSIMTGLIIVITSLIFMSLIFILAVVISYKKEQHPN